MALKWLASLAVVILTFAILDGQPVSSSPSRSAVVRSGNGVGYVPRPLAPGDWPTYHRDNSRHGNAPDLPPFSSLSVAWRARLDGAVYGQPLVIGNRVIAATENDTIYALAPGTGGILWSTHVGEPMPRAHLPCGNIDPLGITGTPVYDPDTGRVFAVAETTGGHHDLVGVNVGTGEVEVRVSVEPPAGNILAHQQRGALTLFNGRVYIPYGGLAGDCGNYLGSVVSAATTGTTDVLRYAVPTTREGGIWAPGGAVVDGTRLLFAVGNGESTSDYDGSDAVIALSPELNRVDFFAPATWAQDNAKDLDLGSMSPALVGPYVYAEGKRGVGYVLRHDYLGGIGGEVAQIQACRAFGGSAIDDAGTLYLPCTDGPQALTITPEGEPEMRWHAPVKAKGSPVVGGGALWVVDYDTGTLYTLNPATGSVLSHVDIGTAPHFCSPTLAGTHAFIGTISGVVAVSGA